MTRDFLLIPIVLLSTACPDHIVELGPKVLTQGQRGDPPSNTAVPSCGPAAHNGFLTACVFDSDGNTYGQGDTSPILPEQPPYGLRFSFDADVELTEADLSIVGEHSSIRVYASQTNVADCGFPEGSEKNRIEARVVPDGGSGFVVSIDEAIPSGNQVVIEFDFIDILRDHLPLPDYEACRSVDDCLIGYASRFYVGEAPPAVDPPLPPDTRKGAVVKDCSGR